jgi:hypothetical protein
MTKKAEEVLTAWFQAVNTGDLEGALALYNEKAVLIPTFSNKLLADPEGIRDYFVKLTSREQLSVTLREKTLTIQPIQYDVYALSGIYLWRFVVEGELLNFEARFSYMLDLTLSAPILHHHSSQVPRML